MRNKEKIYSIGCVLLIIDQVVKLIVKSNMKLFNEIVIIPNFFSIYYVENKGAAFSILGGATIFLVFFGIVALILLDQFINKEKNFSKFGILSLGMIMGGIIGNLIDRLLYGSVIDYLSFSIFNYSFPVFNIADICIIVGAFMYIICYIKEEIKNKKSS